MQGNNLKVHTNLLPFHLHKQTVEVPYGDNLEQMVKRVIPYHSSQVEVILTINGERVPVNMWSKIRPRPAAIVNLNVVPAGGKGGKKNPLATILSIALMVAAPYIAGWATAGIIGMTGATSLATAQAIYGAIRIGIGLVGFLASSALSSTPKQNNKNSKGFGDVSESPTQFIEGASNIIDPFGVVPICLGRNRMFPKQAARPYTETVGNDQYVRQLFTYGYGKVAVEQRKIGETLVENYSGVTMSDRLEGDLNLGTDLYTNDVFQEGLNIAVTNAAGYIIRNTQQDTDEASIDISFLNGLTAYNDQGNRTTAVVNFDLSYRKVGDTDWSTGGTSSKSVGSQSLTATTPSSAENVSGGVYGSNNARYKTFGCIVLNVQSGTCRIDYPSTVGGSPSLSEGEIRIGSFTAQAQSPSYPTGRILTLTDERSSYIPGTITTSGGFALSFTGRTINIAAGTIAPQPIRIADATAEARRIVFSMKFPVRGQYEVRLKRITGDAGSDRIRDVATWTGLRSITYQTPVLLDGISGTAMKILGSDQLNGSVDRYNAVVTSICLDYFASEGVWREAMTDNPASLFRYALQCEAFAKRISDSKIRLPKLEEWHAYCKLKGLSYNRVIDYETSIEDLLADICAAGMATPTYVDGIYSVIIDNERPDIAGIVTPRNSWGYRGNMNYPDLPHALRVQFRNSEKGYEQDERIVYADGYDKTNATLYERLEFQSCVFSDLAFFYGRTYFAQAILQPETHEFYMDFENLDFNRGDRIKFVNDVILVGVGQGRIRSFIYDNPSAPTQILGFTIDDTITIPNTNQFGTRIRAADASGFTYYSLNTTLGSTNTFTFTTPIDVDDSPGIDSLCTFTEFGKELDLIITEIKAGKDQTAKITAINYAPERFNAVSGTIPPFESNITIPADMLPPFAPVLASPIQSDETVMLRNSDGSFTSRMIIPLKNANDATVLTAVKIKPTGATTFAPANTLILNPTLAVLTGLTDGAFYDIEIRYQKQDGLKLWSNPLVLNNTQYIGASGIPSDPTGFMVTSLNEIGNFKWDTPPEIDIDHWIMRFTKLTSGATKTNAQVLDDNIRENRVSFPIQSGTYFLSAVDILGQESSGAAVIISGDDGALKNVVETFVEQPTWSGTRINCQEVGGDLYMTDQTIPAYYYFGDLDLLEVYESYLSSALIAYGDFYLRIRPEASIRALPSVRGSGSILVRSIPSMRAIPSTRGIDPSSWNASLEVRFSQDGVNFGPWEPYTVGKHLFRRIQHRLAMASYDETVNVRIQQLESTIDMPDRLEWGEDVIVPPTGVTVSYSEKFLNNPAVNLTIQDAAVDDRIEYVSKNNQGFTIKVYNATLAGYASRVIDYQSSGYGRIVA